MCDFFWQRMENDQGDLADIVRASGRAGGLAADLLEADWQLPSEPVSSSSSFLQPTNDLFSGTGDHLLNELPISSLFEGQDQIAGQTRIGIQGSGTGSGRRGDGGGALVAPKMLNEETPRPCNIFSRVLQISPGDVKPPLMPPRVIKPCTAIGGSSGCLMDHSSIQISSSRPPGIKRRKGQAKKVVCIPAPAAASSRPSGEVVPSDLWAWRKYGQKPIKGSPYPRGYYRCSSSKGCSARKQVERSRTDPNMLVITYTSEHNHPWPTQRNALAGSTRSQTSKTSTCAQKASLNNQIRAPSLKEEPKDTTSSSSTAPLAKEEEAVGASDDPELDHMLIQSYEPMLPECDQPDDFFADLAELETDPMNLIFPKGLNSGDKIDEERERENKAMDPFNMLDWCGNSFGDAKRGL